MVIVSLDCSAPLIMGFDYRPQNSVAGSDDHLFLRRVEEGKRTHHLHVVGVGSPEIDECRRFRNALRRDPALAADYQKVKVDLAAEYANDRMRYVDIGAEGSGSGAVER